MGIFLSDENSWSLLNESECWVGFHFSSFLSTLPSKLPGLVEIIWMFCFRCFYIQFFLPLFYEVFSRNNIKNHRCISSWYRNSHHFWQFCGSSLLLVYVSHPLSLFWDRSASAKADRLKARNKKRERFWLKWAEPGGRLPNIARKPHDVPPLAVSPQLQSSSVTAWAALGGFGDIRSQGVVVLIGECSICQHAQTTVCVCTKCWKLIVLKQKKLL